MFWDEQSVVQELRERRQPRRRHLARGQRLRRPGRCGPAGHLDLAGQQQAAARGRLRLLSFALGRPRQKQDPYTGDLVRIVEQCTAGCAGQRQHPRPDLPLAEQRSVHQRPQQEHHHQLARERVVRHRRPQLQVRLHRQPARRSAVGEPGAEQPATTASTTACRTSSRMYDQRLPERPLDAQRRLLRPAAVDAQPPDAAGRAALRPRVELGAGAAGWARPLPAAAARFAETPVVDATTTSRRAWRRPTTCSATARRRSRRRSASISRRHSPAELRASGIRPRASPERQSRLDRRQRQLDA